MGGGGGGADRDLLPVEGGGAVCAGGVPGRGGADCLDEPALLGMRRDSLSHRLCPPGLPGRRSRAAEALVAPAGAKLPRMLSAGKDPGTGDKVIALSKAVRPHHRPTGWLAGAGKVLTFTVVLWEHQKRPGLGVAAFSPKQPSRAPKAQEAGRILGPPA